MHCCRIPFAFNEYPRALAVYSIAESDGAVVSVSLVSEPEDGHYVEIVLTPGVRAPNHPDLQAMFAAYRQVVSFGAVPTESFTSGVYQYLDED